MQENQLTNYSKEGGDKISVTPLYMSFSSWNRYLYIYKKIRAHFKVGVKE
jgi:hypothetical protein